MYKLILCYLTLVLSGGYASAQNLSPAVKKIPTIEQAIVFQKSKSDASKDYFAADVKYAEFVAQNQGPYRFYDSAGWSEWAFFGRLQGKGEVLPSKRSDFLLSDELVASSDWPLRYVVRIYDPIVNAAPGPTDFRPYAKRVQIDARRFDLQGRELDVITEKPTDRRVFKLGQTYYLGTEATPRKLLSIFEWQLCKQPKVLTLIPCSSNRLKSDESLQDVRTNDAELFDKGLFTNLPFFGLEKAASTSVYKEFYAYHTDPIKPLIISDYAVTPEGRVTKGKAMCVSDCPNGYQFKLLRQGDAIPLSR